jgi:hypothetical protein
MGSLSYYDLRVNCYKLVTCLHIVISAQSPFNAKYCYNLYILWSRLCSKFEVIKLPTIFKIVVTSTFLKMVDSLTMSSLLALLACPLQLLVLRSGLWQWPLTVLTRQNKAGSNVPFISLSFKKYYCNGATTLSIVTFSITPLFISLLNMMSLAIHLLFSCKVVKNFEL